MASPAAPAAGSVRRDGGGFFLDCYPVETGQADRPFARKFYEPLFATSTGSVRFGRDASVCVAALTHELISAEMSSREKKEYEKRKGVLPIPPVFATTAGTGRLRYGGIYTAARSGWTEQETGAGN